MAVLDNFDLEVSFPINGSWMNTFYQWLRNYNDGNIKPNGFIIKVSEPTWSGSNTFTRFPTGFAAYDYLITNGDGTNVEAFIAFSSQTTISSSFGTYVSGGSGYKVGDTITLPSLTIPQVTGDIVFTVLEVVEY